MSRFILHTGSCLDVLPQLPDRSIHTCVTSPPYWKLRDYEAEGQLGQEKTAAAYVRNLVGVFHQVRRVLRTDGTLWLNLGDSYCRSDSKRQGLKKGDLAGIPWQVALALREDGWFLRSSIIWEKTSCLPESVTDRPTKSHEYLFLLSASRRYYYDQAAIREPVAASTLTRHAQARTMPRREAKPAPPLDSRIARMNGRYRDTPPEAIAARGRNRRTVWRTPTAASSARGIAHHATYPPALITPCVLAGSPVGGAILDPFAGSGTTGLVALQQGRDFVGIELNPSYAELARERLLACTAAL